VAHQFARDWAGRSQREVQGRQQIADVADLGEEAQD
jgi:hypothetical protein